jgi:hypothetical protein
MQEIEDAIADSLGWTWIATMTNTCHRCLPLHGKTLTKDEWDSMGYSTETIHDGWDSDCQCTLVPAKYTEMPDDLKLPLVRQKAKDEYGKAIKGKTIRGVTQQDIDKAVKSMKDAMESEEGRKTIRLLGQLYGE